MSTIAVIENADGSFTASIPVQLTSLDSEVVAPAAVVLADTWTAEERAAFGVYLARAADVPEGHIVTASRFERIDGEVVQLVELEIERTSARAAIEARGAEAFLAGYAPAHPAFAGERLQVRDGDDRTNWLTSQASYAAAVAGGFGDVVDASFRTAGNRTITVTYAEGLQVLLDMASWGRGIMARIWALKDADAAGEAYDIDSGWPA